MSVKVRTFIVTTKIFPTFIFFAEHIICNLALLSSVLSVSLVPLVSFYLCHHERMRRISRAVRRSTVSKTSRFFTPFRMTYVSNRSIAFEMAANSEKLQKIAFFLRKNLQNKKNAVYLHRRKEISLTTTKTGRFI